MSADITADVRTDGRRADDGQRHWGSIGKGFVYTAPDMSVRPGRDWGRITDNAILACASVVTFGVGNWSIATLLHDAGAPWVAACGAAGVFDLIALAASARVYRLRSSPHRALGPMIVMMTAVLTSMVVNAAHGWYMGGWMVAAVLGAVPLAFESVWLMQHGMKPWGVLRHFRTERSDLIRRDAHAALYGMSASVDMSIRDVRPSATPVRTDSGQRKDIGRTPVMRALSATPVLTNGQRTDATIVADMSGRTAIIEHADTEDGQRTDATDVEDGQAGKAQVKPGVRPNVRPSVASVETRTRVNATVELLRSGEDVTGSMLAARYGVTDRTGRRILLAAREIVERAS